MEAYEYVVKNNQNETEKGLMWGDSEQEIAIRLKRDGYRIYRISLQDERKKHKWNHTMVVDVTYQLGLLIESGVPLRRALQLLCQGKRGLLYTALYESIERGQTLSQALRSEGCPPIALALLESGEAAGTLGESLQYISLKVWALLLDSGISIIHTMNITRPLWGNIYGVECSKQVEARLLSGHSLEESLRSGQIGNAFIWQMVSIGEESGELVKMLNHCGYYYESILSKYIARLERLLEPILLTIMGIGVAVLVVSVMYPLFTSIANLGGQ
ncbi:MAG: type II secretion system F family protein [Veillonella sp.]|nr:type II secretion system F family protein [Veillonella sp.]